MDINSILAYANMITDDSFADLSSIIDYLNEAQEIIARWDMIEAAPIEYELTTNVIALPSDFLKLYKITLDDIPFNPPEEPWNGTLTFGETVTSGTIKLWYYKSPAALSAATPTQVPDIHEKYHRAMAKYAAKMFNLSDDDEGLRDAYAREFSALVASMRTNKGTTITYKNL